MASQGKNSAMVWIIAACLFAAVYGISAKTVKLTWAIPSTNGNLNYTLFNEQQAFAIGDEIEFDFTQGDHTVLQVTGPNFAACNATDVIKEWDTPPVVVPLTEKRQWFFCGVGTHCAAGQKVLITASPVIEEPVSPSPSTGNNPGASPGGAGSSRTMSALIPSIVVVGLCFLLVV